MIDFASMVFFLRYIFIIFAIDVYILAIVFFSNVVMDGYMRICWQNIWKVKISYAYVFLMI